MRVLSKSLQFPEPLGEGKYKTQVKVFPNFTSVPFDCKHINIMGDELR